MIFHKIIHRKKIIKLGLMLTLEALEHLAIIEVDHLITIEDTNLHTKMV
jgi:hypothetical protein